MDNNISRKTRIHEILKVLIASIFIFHACSSNDEYDMKNFKRISLEFPGKCEAWIPEQRPEGGQAISKDGKIYLAYSSPSYIYALNKDCQLIWGIEITSKNTFICEYESLTIGENDDIYVLSEDPSESNRISFLNSISPEGKLNWSLEFEGDCNINNPLAIGSDGTIYHLKEGYRNLYSISPGGTINWTVEFPGELSWNIIIGPEDTIYLNEISGIFYAVSKDGKIVFSINLFESNVNEGKEYVWRTYIGPDGMIYIISRFVDENNNENYYLIKLNQEGKIVWRISLESGDLGYIPLLIGPEGNIYVDVEIPYPTLYSYDQDGNIKWLLRKNEIFGYNIGVGLGPLNSEGNMYLSTSDNKTYVIDNTGGILNEMITGDYNFVLMDEKGNLYSFHSGKLSIFSSESEGYSKSGWPMEHHDPQNTNRWDGGS